jgi:fucose permease
VTFVFFLWGFAYGLLNVLNFQFEVIAKLDQSESLGLHAAYFCGYLVGPLTLGRFILKKYGFKSAMIAGFCVYSCGTLVFWPSAVLTSYTAFVISNFIVGFGLSCLEIAANPFIGKLPPLRPILGERLVLFF